MSLGTFLSGTPTQLRGIAWLALSDEGQIGAGTVVSDGGGGGTATFAYGTLTACRVDPISGDERLTADRLDSRSTHLITLPPATPITPANRFLTGGTTFEIVAVREQTGELLRFAEAVQVS